MHTLRKDESISVYETDSSETPDIILIDLDPTDAVALRAVPAVIGRYDAPSLALVPRLDRAIEQRLRSFGVDVVRTRPDPALLKHDGLAQPLVALLRATVLVHGKRPLKRHVPPMRSNRLSSRVFRHSTGTEKPRDHPRAEQVLLIGASTGGPPAVQTVLSGLTEIERYAILIVQHISRGFIDGYARWLQTSTGLDVREAIEDEAILSGSVLLAPSDVHLIVSGRRVGFDRSERRNYQRPSVDVLFQSAADEYGAACVAVLLTGMGRDGAEGLLAISKAGGHTIAQDEKSSVIWGMPRAAITLGAANEVLSLGRIADHAEIRLREIRQD